MNMQAMKNWFARVGSVVAIGTTCGIIGGLGGYAAMSYAAGINLGGVDDNHIPYQGFLEDGGVPVDGELEFVFTLYNSETGSAASNKLWTSKARNLQVSRGYFATVLGDEVDGNTNRIDSTVMAQKMLYVGMKVDGVELSGRQRILAVPYAQNSMPTHNFMVDGKLQTIDLAASGNVAISGTILAAKTATFNQSVNAKSILNVDGVSNLKGDVNATKKLTVDGVSTLKDKATLEKGIEVTGMTTLNNALSVAGTTSTTGRITANGGIRVEGTMTTGGISNLDKLVQFQTVSRSSKSEFPLSVESSFSSTDWNCTVGSFLINGDINESGRHTPLLEVSTYVSSGKWRVWVDMAHDHKSDTKGFDVQLVCFSTKISHRR